jgi:hypothetical protein
MKAVAGSISILCALDARRPVDLWCKGLQAPTQSCDMSPQNGGPVSERRPASTDIKVEGDDEP